MCFDVSEEKVAQNDYCPYSVSSHLLFIQINVECISPDYVFKGILYLERDIKKRFTAKLGG